MILSDTVQVRWISNLKKWYLNKGYEYTKMYDYFECNVEDLMPTSTIKVKVKCDYCNKIHEKEYRDYLKQREVIEKDCCSDKNCGKIKTREICNKLHGVDNYSKLEHVKEKQSKRKRADFNTVLNLFKEKNLILLSDESDYKNDRSNLKFICKYHEDKGVQETSFSNIKSLKGCCSYKKGDLIAESRRYDGDFIIDEFKSKGFIPLFKPEDYINNETKLPCLCISHKDKGVQYIRYTTLKTRKGCYYCSKESTKRKLRLNHEEVFKYFHSRNLIVDDIETYINKDVKIKCICNKHPEHQIYISYGQLKQTNQPCSLCREELNTTKLSKRLRGCINEWKESSKKYCNNSCVFTNSRSYQIHHVYSFKDIVLESLNNLNIQIKEQYSSKEILLIKEEVKRLHEIYPPGICIHPELHTLLHSEFGKNTNEEDLNEFIKNYFNYIYDDKLSDEVKYSNIAPYVKKFA